MSYIYAHVAFTRMRLQSIQKKLRFHFDRQRTFVLPYDPKNRQENLTILTLNLE